MRLALVLGLAVGVAAQSRESRSSLGPERVAQLVAELKVEAKAAYAAEQLAQIGGPAVLALADALEVLTTDTLDNQGWKERVLEVLANLGEPAKDAAADVLVAAYKLPVTLTGAAFRTLGVLGPHAHIQFQMRRVRMGTAIAINDQVIPGSSDQMKLQGAVMEIQRTVQLLRASAQDLAEAVAWLDAQKQDRGEARDVPRLELLLQDLTRQALVVELYFQGKDQHPSALRAARALVDRRVPDPVAAEARGLLLLLGTPAEKLAAATALAQGGTTSRHVMRTLRRTLRDPDPRIVREAITALGVAGERASEAAPELEKLAAHADSQTAQRAKAALRRLRR